jgi:phosphopantothenoylcysteine decarboxylase/phosphopantothenate--cysteine ligase
LPDAPFTVGFAAETDNLEPYAAGKLEAKGLDLVAANLVGAERGGFGADDNAMVVLWRGGRRAFPMMPKPRLAMELARLIAERYRASRGSMPAGMLSDEIEANQQDACFPGRH